MNGLVLDEKSEKSYDAIQKNNAPAEAERFFPERRHFDKCVSLMIHQRLYYFGMVSGKIFPSPVLCAPPRPNNLLRPIIIDGPDLSYREFFFDQNLSIKS